MSKRDWLKLVVLILLPINAWLCLFYYQKRWRWVRMYIEGHQREQETMAMKLEYLRKRQGWLIKEGLPLRFPHIDQVIGKFPPIGRGIPVLFLYISWCAEPEVWDLAVKEALQVNPTLHVALLHDLPTTYKDNREVIDTKRLPLARQLWEKFTKKFQTDRISVLTSRDWWKAWGNMEIGILAVICDGRGIVRAIEPYPPLGLSAYWHEEVKDWRPKLHQAVKNALEKFYGKPSGTQGR
ncbi:hypothetical protein B0813_002147 [Candidatus Fervidibacteria bacterium JGI MDM2 SSWTFF-3-K9]